ncbi:MAG: pseudouridine synthase [Candidatus Omnitrophica bacterium]|nr:pseudouridine synthase [Candidatus Omnitrophota bacterium]
MRLNAYIAKAGVASRRKATELVKAGKAKVGGKVMLEPWYIVKDDDSVTVNGKVLRSEEHLYFIINKPKGVTATVEDPHALKKITQMVSSHRARLYPIGRLDKDSRGLILLTNDGDLCYQLTHPRFEVEKEYCVIVSGTLDEKSLMRIKGGVFDEGDVLKVKSYSGVKKSGDGTALHVVIAEGKKRHLRRLFKAIGNPVVDLKRIRIGGLTLGDVKEGSFKKIGRDDIYRLTINKRSTHA